MKELAHAHSSEDVSGIQFPTCSENFEKKYSVTLLGYFDLGAGWLLYDTFYKNIGDSNEKNGSFSGFKKKEEKRTIRIKNFFVSICKCKHPKIQKLFFGVFTSPLQFFWM